MKGWGGNYSILNLDIPQGIKFDRTIMQLQGIESLIPEY